MNSNVKQRKGRPAPGGRRNRAFDKTIMNEGVYTNPRLVHSTLLLVGCSVQVQVKNGGLYEGIFKTMSPDSHIVLEMAHKMDPSTPRDTVPTRDMLVHSLIFALSDIVQISAIGVDLDYALKDNFTDSAIAKLNNGGSVERELQPWDGDSQDGALESLEKSATTTSANGWAPEDMFNTNADKFDIKSSYDPNLSQYTTPLVKQDTKEYRDREAHAARLAQEIEKTEDYGKRMALENGDGDDEELMYSAVHRPGEANNNSATTSGKYVPPHLRKVTPAQNRPTGLRQTPPADSPSPHGQSPSPHQQPSPVMNVPMAGVTQVHPAGQRSPSQPTPVQVSVSTAVAVSDESENKNKDENECSDQQDRARSSERINAGPPVVPNNPIDPKKNPVQGRKIQELKEFGNSFKLKGKESTEGMERKQGVPGAPLGPGQLQPVGMSQVHVAHAQSHMVHQDHALQQSLQQVQQPPQMTSSPSYTHIPPTVMMPQHGTVLTVIPDNKPITTAVASAVGTVPSDKKEDEKHELDDDKDKKNLSLKLNPLAKEFVPAAATPAASNSKPTYVHRTQPAPVPTPPRAATQSPVIVPAGYPYPYMITPGHPTPQLPQAARHNPAKRATVSAQAAAATGQPLLQTPMQAQNPQYPMPAPYNLQMAANAQGQTMPQGMVQMAPGGTSMRVITPQMMPGATTPTDQMGFQQGQHPHVFVHPHPNFATMQSYMTHYAASEAGGAVSGNQQTAQTPHSMPTHMAPHHQATPPHTQANHMSSQGAGSNAHPNPSPGPHHATANHLPPQQQAHHPSNSGTPQPQHVIYPHTGQTNPQQGGPGHPPLQPSPHTPTSPHNMYSSMPYSQSFTVPPQLAYNTSAGQQQPAILTLTQASHHHQHQQLAMMSNHQHHPNMHQPNPGVNHQIQHNVAAAAAAGPPQQHGQYQLNHPTLQQGHHMQGGPPLTGQAGPGLPVNFVPQQHIVPQNPQHYHHNQ